MNIWKIMHFNRSERYEDMIDHHNYTHNLSSCEIKAWEKFRIQTHDLCNTGAVLYQPIPNGSSSLPGFKHSVDIRFSESFALCKVGYIGDVEGETSFFTNLHVHVRDTGGLHILSLKTIKIELHIFKAPGTWLKNGKTKAVFCIIKKNYEKEKKQIVLPVRFKLA